MRIESPVTSVTKGNQVYVFGQASPRPRANMMYMQFDIHIISATPPTNTATVVIPLQYSHSLFGCWRTVELCFRYTTKTTKAQWT